MPDLGASVGVVRSPRKFVRRWLESSQIVSGDSVLGAR
jgi:hypothetical protein